MKHLVPTTLAPAPFFNVKEMTALPLDVPLSFGDYVTVKDEFASDNEDGFDDFDIDLSSGSDWSSYDSLPTSQAVVKKNKRKNLVPQRAVQSETSMSGSVGNSSSESSQDAMNVNTFEMFNDTLQQQGERVGQDEEIPEGEDCLNEIDEENIFKNLQEETDGDSIDKNILENVKEEWRSNWSIKCNMCEKVFLYKSEFDTHYRTSYDSTPVYTCSFCDRTMEKYSTFRSHVYRHATDCRFKCKECQKGFSLQSLLHVHTAKHSRAKPFKCEECGKFFVTKPGLKIHVKKHKNEVKEDYPCVECGKILHTRGGLTSHMNVHRLGRRFMCDVCGKTFTQKVNMQQHVKQHTGDKPHECDKCGKTFAEKSHLARHYSFHSEQRPYKCEVCQKMYKTERCLKVHSMVHAKERPYICTFCNKGFLSSTKLKQHYNIHTGERPYACKYCERKFTNYPNWLKHTRRRHNVDHKTGENLPPRVPKKQPVQTLRIPKEEPPATPLPAPTEQENDPYSFEHLLDPLANKELININANPDYGLGDYGSEDKKYDNVNLVNFKTNANINLGGEERKSTEFLNFNTFGGVEKKFNNTDFVTFGADDMLLNFPTEDDKFLLQAPDLLTSGANFLVPYYANATQSSSQLSDYVPVQFI